MRGHLAYRYVHENHTYRHRMGEVFRRVGLEPPHRDQPPVSVLMPTKRPENVARCLENFTRQTYQNKELVLILNNAEFDLDAISQERRVDTERAGAPRGWTHDSGGLPEQRRGSGFG